MICVVVTAIRTKGFLALYKGLGPDLPRGIMMNATMPMAELASYVDDCSRFVNRNPCSSNSCIARLTRAKSSRINSGSSTWQHMP